MLAEKANSFNEDPEVKEILLENHSDSKNLSSILSYSKHNAETIWKMDVDPEKLSKAGLQYEKLDQIAIEHIMGTR